MTLDDGRYALHQSIMMGFRVINSATTKLDLTEVLLAITKGVSSNNRQ